jgi:hypothetical protein
LTEKKPDERDNIEADLRRYKEFFGTENYKFEDFYKRLVPPNLQTDAWKEEFEYQALEAEN